MASCNIQGPNACTWMLLYKANGFVLTVIINSDPAGGLDGDPGHGAKFVKRLGTGSESWNWDLEHAKYLLLALK